MNRRVYGQPLWYVRVCWLFCSTWLSAEQSGGTHCSQSEDLLITFTEVLYG
jgi:hypothetical protein